nr:hypothetical protein GCM10020063_029010 [Dactylosporangium thailandense]
MSAVRAFRPITAAELAWRTELGADDPEYVELWWLDAALDNGWQVGIGLYRSRPFDGGRPAITVNLLRPGEPFLELHHGFAPDEFEPYPFGGRWGEGNQLVGGLSERGDPAAFDLTLDVGRLRLELAATVVCAGVKFTTASPGFTHHRPASATAIGWWPVAPRADVSGWIALDGDRVPVRGRVHAEKQLSSLPLAGREKARSAQSVWTWGHFTCGDYTGLWTDSAASEQLGYRHFTPFVLYREGEPILSTFAFASSVERFRIEPGTGLPRPEVVTLKAAQGELEFFARLTDGRVSDQFELDGNEGAYYCRQMGRIDAELYHWGRATRLTGDVVHEWGTQAGNFPFAAVRP